MMKSNLSNFDEFQQQQFFYKYIIYRLDICIAYYLLFSWQMEANVIGTDIANTKLEHKYNLIPGCTSLKRYSIYLIAKVWPSDLVQYIESILENLSRTKGVQVLCSLTFYSFFYTIFP